MSTPGTRLHPSRPGLPARVRAQRRAAARPRAASRCVALPVLPGDGGRRRRSLGPGRRRARRRARHRPARRCCEIARATGKAGEVDHAAGAAAAARTTTALRWVLLVGVGDAAPDRPAPRRRGAGPGHPRPRRRRHHRSPAVAGDDGLEAFVVGAMLGSFAFHWRSDGRPSTPGRAGSCSAGLPDDDDRRPSSRRAVARRRRRLARPDARDRARPTSRTPQWLAEQAVALGRRGRPRVDGLGRAAARRARASAASSASARRSATPPRLIRLDYTPAQARAARRPRRAGRQGHHLRHRRPSIKPGEAMVDDEARHDRRRRGHRRDGRAAPTSAARSGSPAWSPPPRTPSAATRCGPAT